MTSAWSGLTLQRRMIVVAATLGMFAAVLLLARTATSPRMALLYAGLDPAAAGEVIANLEAQGAVVDVRGSAIYVDASQRDALRMILAGAGLPADGGQGYELLHALSGFGTTSQMFDAAYWRAKEGELARTITANRQIVAARVHISNPTNNPFSRGLVSSASVTVTMGSGTLGPDQTMALRYLVSSAVSGLDAADVSVIDSRRGLVQMSSTAGDANLGGNDRHSELLRANVTRMLEARVGSGSAIVEVSVQTIAEREAITERVFDPDSRVAISTENEEKSSRANDTRGGAVTVASNLPEGDAGGDGQNSESNETTTREITNFEVSETMREVLREPGRVRRISVAVLVDGLRTIGEDGAPVWEERPEEELADLRVLVASAIGFDPERGDEITIRSLEFKPAEVIVAPTPPALLDRLQFDAMALVQLSVLAVVSLILGLFVVRPILAGGGRSSMPQLPAPAGRAALSGGNEPLNGEIDTADFSGSAFPAGLNLPDLSVVGAPGSGPAARLRQLIEARQDDSVEVLSQWMTDQTETAR